MDWGANTAASWGSRKASVLVGGGTGNGKVVDRRETGSTLHVLITPSAAQLHAWVELSPRGPTLHLPCVLLAMNADGVFMSGNQWKSNSSPMQTAQGSSTEALITLPWPSTLKEVGPPAHRVGKHLCLLLLAFKTSFPEQGKGRWLSAS